MSNSGTEYLNGYEFSGIVLIDASGRKPQYVAEVTKSEAPSPVGAALISDDIVRRYHLEKNNRIEGRYKIISPYPARVVYIKSINGNPLMELN